MKTLYPLVFVLIVTVSSFGQNQYINDSNPVGRNIGFYLESGEVAWRTSFNLTQSGTNLLTDLASVQLVGRVVWSTGIQRNQNFETTLTPVNGSPGLYETILRSEEGSKSVVFKRAPANDAKWDQLSVSVSYLIKGVKYTLPEVVVFSPTVQDGVSTKLDLVNRGIVIDNNSIMIFANVNGSQSVKLTKAEVTTENGSSVKSFANEYTGLGPFRVKLDLPNAQPIIYKIKISAETSTGALLTPVEKEVSFSNHLKITSINGDIDVSNGYRFAMLDKLSKTFQITTNGAGDLIVAPISKNHAVKLINQGNGIYQLSITSNKITFDDEENLELSANGIKLPGEWVLFRENPEPTISTSQVSNSGVDFQVRFPNWVTGDVSVQIPKRGSSFSLPNSSAVSHDGMKVFNLSLAKSDFSLLNSATDSIFNGKVNILLANKRLLSQEFRFLNVDYYVRKIAAAQKISDKNSRKTEIKQVLSSLFESTGSTPDESLVKSIVSNLSSGKDEDKKNGINQVLGFATKLAPLLIALI